MRHNINPALALGIILNFTNLMLKHLHVYEALKVPQRAQGFITGAVAGCLLVGLVILALGPERMTAFKEWKSHLFGG